MDPVTLAITVAGFLSPYLVKAGEKAFETVGEKSVGSLWRAVTAKFTGKPAAEESVKDLVVRPDDQLTQSAFANQLKKVLELEPAVADGTATSVGGYARATGDATTSGRLADYVAQRGRMGEGSTRSCDRLRRRANLSMGQ